MAPPSQYLFINKTSQSPSLSRNTGSEANLASKVNHHVQKSRFQHVVEQRTSDASSHRSNSSSPGSSSSINSPPLIRYLERRQHPPRSSSAPCPARAKPRIRQKAQSTSSNIRPISTTQALVRQCDIVSNDQHSSSSDDGGSKFSYDNIDPWDSVVIGTHLLSARLRGVVERYMSWAINASVTATVVTEGLTVVYQRLLTDELHRAAFLAAATAHETKAKRIVLPVAEGPDEYRHQATTLISRHFAAHKEEQDSYFPADVFRLAMAEWLGGSVKSARIHFRFLSDYYKDCTPRDHYDLHHIELVSTADLFLAVDSDLPTLLNLTWVPLLPLGPFPPLTHVTSPDMSGVKHGQSLIQFVSDLDSNITQILKSLFTDFGNFANFTLIDYAQGLTGPVWAMKRRMQGAISSLQKMTSPRISIADCIRRTLVLVMFLATTSAMRRENRTNVGKLARRLRDSMQDCQALRTISLSANTVEQGLQLWMYLAGLAGAHDGLVASDVRDFFLGRASLVCLQMRQNQNIRKDDLHRLLGQYMTFFTVHKLVVDELFGRFQAGSLNLNVPITAGSNDLFV